MNTLKRLVISLLPIAFVIGLGQTAYAAAASTERSDDLVSRRIEAHGVQSFNYRVEAGQFVWFEMEGFGTTDLDLHIFDQYGDELVSDERLDDYGLIWVRMPISQTITVEVTNLGRVASWFDLSATSSRGYADIDFVDAYSTHRRTYWVSAGELVWFEIDGDDDTDLDLVIRDEFGREIVADRGYTDHGLVVLRLDRSQYVTIEVENLGNVYNMFQLLIH